MDITGWTADDLGFEEHSNQAVISMGDKSPKAKDKAKKQDSADKNQKKAAANAKANQASAQKKSK